MKLICEEIENVQFLTETNAKGKKQFFIEGIFLQAGIVNRNGRKYSKEILEREVTRYTRDYINNNRATGELGHPMGPNINLDRVSHKIVELKQNGDNFIGKALLTRIDTPGSPGNIAMGLMEDGIQLGVSSRGMGSLKEKNGINEVQDDFYLATAADIVADPSAPDAFVQGIMEGREWCWDGDILREYKANEFKKKIETISAKEVEATKLKMFEQFVKGL